ncbi:hypothetical protein HMPREF1146_1181 [Prevotella sp. MSX73]|nr:hypothetical protein HMPREF1146_1181 [Prevotella sp. MSX73]
MHGDCGRFGVQGRLFRKFGVLFLKFGVALLQVWRAGTGKTVDFFGGLKAIFRSGWKILADAVLFILFATIRWLAETAYAGLVGAWAMHGLVFRRPATVRIPPFCALPPRVYPLTSVAGLKGESHPIFCL